MSWLDRLVGRTPPTSASGTVAKERLKIVLEYDRAQLSPGELDLIRDEIIQSISRHVEVAREDVEIKLEPGGRLVAEIPLSRNRE
jgi:cell division topological specificity factor